MNEITLDQALKERTEMEGEILANIMAFQEKSSLVVDSIKLITSNRYDGKTKLHAVKIDIKLP